MSPSWGLRTKLVHGGQRRSPMGETCEALWMTSGFAYAQAEDAEGRFADRLPGFMYSRVGNPTVRTFEERMMLLEGAEEAAATATGMAAVNATLMCQLRAGSRVVAARCLFGSCHYILTEVLPRFGVEVQLVDGRDLGDWALALSRKTDAVFIETPGNPTLELVDIKAVAELAHKAGARLIVDNVFATPILQHPLELGADIVVYSATKHIDGQGRCLGGVILCSAEFKKDHLQPYLKNTGPALSPFNAWLLTKGLETLDLRVREHVAFGRSRRRIPGAPSRGRARALPWLPSHPQHALAKRQMLAGGGLVRSVGGDR